MTRSVVSALTVLVTLGACASDGIPDEPVASDAPVDVDPLTLSLTTDLDRDDLVVAAVVYAIGRQVATAPVRDGQATLEIPVPGEGVVANVRGEEGAREASYLLVTFLDADGDGEKDDEEFYVGTSVDTLTLAYVEGATDAMRTAGRRDGWSLLDPEDAPLDPDRLEVPADFLPVETLRLEGTSSHPDPDAHLAMVSISPASVFDVTAEVALGDGTWVLEFTGPPPEHHAIDDLPDFIPQALIAYVDATPPEGPVGDITDEPLVACADGHTVVPGWLRPPTSLAEAVQSSRFNATAGWEIWDLAEDDVLPLEARTRLAVGPGACDP